MQHFYISSILYDMRKHNLLQKHKIPVSRVQTAIAGVCNWTLWWQALVYLRSFKVKQYWKMHTLQNIYHNNQYFN